MGEDTQTEMLKNLKPNSKAYHESQKKSIAKAKDIPDKPEKLEKVVKGTATLKKPSAAKKVEEALLADDAKTVKTYLLWDVLIPAIKDTLSDLVKKGIDALLFGEEHRGNGSVKRSGDTSYVSYSSYYNRNRDRSGRAQASRGRSRRTMSFDDILFETRADAEEVLENLVDLTMMYGLASVSDFYELAGIEYNYIDNRWGWYELSEARVLRVRDGYILDLPRTEKLDIE